MQSLSVVYLESSNLAILPHSSKSEKTRSRDASDSTDLIRQAKEQNKEYSNTRKKIQIGFDEDICIV